MVDKEKTVSQTQGIRQNKHSNISLVLKRQEYFKNMLRENYFSSTELYAGMGICRDGKLPSSSSDFYLVTSGIPNVVESVDTKIFEKVCQVPPQNHCEGMW